MRRAHSRGDRNAIARQQRIVKGSDVQPGIPVRRKRHAYDCGNTQCLLCHGDKFPQRMPTRAEVKSSDSFSQQSENEWEDYFGWLEPDESTILDRINERWPDEWGMRYAADWEFDEGFDNCN